MDAKLYDFTFHVTLLDTSNGIDLVVLYNQAFVWDPATKAIRRDAQFHPPLSEDVELENHPHRNGCIVRRGNERWPLKTATDVIIDGDACAHHGTPVKTMLVTARVGEASKSILVLGDRSVRKSVGGVRFSEPVPFSRISLDWWNAYGGVDPNLLPRADKEPASLGGSPIIEFFPGAYPRNPMGTGYWVKQDNVIDGLLLPNLEDPNQRLCPESLFCEEPELWWRQPLPQSFSWISPRAFPRCVDFGNLPYFLPIAADLAKFPETLSGHLDPAVIPSDPQLLSVNTRLTQSAEPNMRLYAAARQVPIHLDGFDPDGEIKFDLPLAPCTVRVRTTQTAGNYEGQPHLHTLYIRPNDRRLVATWAHRFPLPERDLAWVQDEGLDLEAFAERFEVKVDTETLGRQHWPMPRLRGDEQNEQDEFNTRFPPAMRTSKDLP